MTLHAVPRRSCPAPAPKRRLTLAATVLLVYLGTLVLGFLLSRVWVYLEGWLR